MNDVPRITTLRIIVAFCAFAVLSYGGFSIWVVGWSDDPGLRGDVIGTWKSFAVAAFAFWVGSSSGGKTNQMPEPGTTTTTTTTAPKPKGEGEDAEPAPQPVIVMNEPEQPVPTTTEEPQP